MRTVCYLIFSLVLTGCSTDPARYSVADYTLRLAPRWDSSFVHSPTGKTGILFEIPLPRRQDARHYMMLYDSLVVRAHRFTVLLWRYPIDTTLRKTAPNPIGFFGPHPEFLYDFNSTPRVLHGVKNDEDTLALLPISADFEDGLFYFLVPPGEYLLWMNAPNFQPEPEMVKDVVVYTGNFSIIKIALNPMRIY